MFTATDDWMSKAGPDTALEITLSNVEITAF